jgi:hypothetical protein
MKIGLFLILFIVSNLNAQYTSVGADSKVFNAFEACSGIQVVLSGDKNFDEGIKSSLKSNWNLKPVEFIDNTTFENTINDETKAFMLLVKISDEKGQQVYHFLAIIMGGKKKIRKYSYDDMVAYCPLNGFGGESPLTNCAFRLPILIYQLQSVINLNKKNDFGSNSFTIGKNLNKFYSQNAKKIKSKTLLINTDAANFKFTADEIKKEGYKYPVEYCNNEKIAEVIKNKDPKYAILQPAITLNKFIMVFDAATYECLYSKIDVMGMKVKIGDIKEIYEAIKN